MLIIASFTDVGFVQKSSLCEDIPKTLQSLNDFLPFKQPQLEGLAEQVNEMECRLVLCDIAPMGIEVAKAANIPSVLIENFTWDWIYEGYLSEDFPIEQHIAYLKEICESTDYHIQAGPVCHHQNADLTTLPISRRAMTPAHQICQELGVPEDAKIVLVTMGGIPEKYTFIEQLSLQSDMYFIIPCGSKSMQLVNNVALLPHHSNFFHPDLINACGAVIGKLGYSTLAEVYHAGVPYGYIPRPAFKESGIFEAFIKKEMNGFAISEKQFQDGSWLSLLPKLLELPRTKRSTTNGAVEVADFTNRVLRAES